MGLSAPAPTPATTVTPLLLAGDGAEPRRRRADAGEVGGGAAVDRGRV